MYDLVIYDVRFIYDFWQFYYLPVGYLLDNKRLTVAAIYSTGPAA